MKFIIILILIILIFYKYYNKNNLKIENYKKKTNKIIYNNYNYLDWDLNENTKVIISKENCKYIFYVLFSENNPDINYWEKNRKITLNNIISNLVQVIGPNYIFKKTNKYPNYKDYEKSIYKRTRLILINYYDCSLVNTKKLASGNISMIDFVQIKRDSIFNLFKKYIEICIPDKIFTDRLNINNLIHLLMYEYYLGNYKKSYKNSSVYLYNIHKFEKSNYIIVDSIENNELMLQLSRCLKKSAKKIIYKIFSNSNFDSHFEDTVETLNYYLNNEEGKQYFNINNKLSHILNKLKKKLKKKRKII